MKINKQLLEELILEVLKEEDDLNEDWARALKNAFTKKPRASQQTQSPIGRTRSAGPGIEDNEVAMAAAGRLSNAAALKSQLKNPRVQQVLRQISDTLSQQGSNQQKARFLGMLMAELGVDESIASLIAGELRTAAKDRAAKSTKMAAGLPARSADSKRGVNPMRQRGGTGDAQTDAASKKFSPRHSIGEGKRKHTIRIRRKK